MTKRLPAGGFVRVRFDRADARERGNQRFPGMHCGVPGEFLRALAATRRILTIHWMIGVLYGAICYKRRDSVNRGS